VIYPFRYLKLRFGGWLTTDIVAAASRDHLSCGTRLLLVYSYTSANRKG